MYNVNRDILRILMYKVDEKIVTKSMTKWQIDNLNFCQKPSVNLY